MRKNPLLLLLLLIFIILFTQFQKPNKEYLEQLNQGKISILTQKESYNRGKEVKAIIQNNTDKEIVLPKRCPLPPLEVYIHQNGKFQPIEKEAKIDCTNISEIKILPHEKEEVSFKNWNNAIFLKLSRYQLNLNIKINDKEETFNSNEFIVNKESIIGYIWKTFLYRPIYNVLIFFTSVLPYHSLGLAIILLTILIRTILLIPSQKALRSQKKLQQVQPKLEAIKKKYKDNQQKIGEETMRIWKEHKVNPFGSCLPMLLQFPVLIGLFYVIRDVTIPDNTYLLYSPLQNFPIEQISVNFLRIFDLTKNNVYILPLIVGGLQFLQMKLQFALKKSKEKEEKKKEAKEMAVMNNVMTYFMPVMIAVFTASVPAGVGLYWGTSTLYGIGQQIVVNREGGKKKNL